MQLRALADSDLVALLDAISGLGVAEQRRLLIAALPELLGPYLSASGELAGVLFEDLRAEAGRRGVFYAENAAQLRPVESTVRWAVDPLVNESLGSSVFSRLSGSIARQIMDASRDTVEFNSARERVAFQRMARPNACAFCVMLASRPPSMAYKSEYSSMYVVGRGSERTGYGENGKRLRGGIGGGIKPRGSRKLGQKYHDDCQCTVTAVYPGTEMAELAKVERENAALKYQLGLSDDDGNRLRGTKDILAQMRKNGLK